MLQLGKCLRSAALGAQWFSTSASTADAVVKRSGKVPRSVKEQERECGLAAAFFKEGKRSSLRKLMKIVAKQKESNELTGRSAAFAAALAIKLGKYSEAHSMLTYASATPAVICSSLLVKLLSSEARFDDALDEVENCLQNEDELFNTANSSISNEAGKYSEAHSMLTYATTTPTVIRSSLLVKLLSSEARFDDALDELENCLQNEDELFNTANSSISNEALDDLCNAIRARDDTQKQMQRFRALQRLLTTYNRRCTKTVDELLCTPIQVTPIEDKPLESPQIPLTDKVISEIPHFLSDT
ncbi:hypothetical protein Q1695_010476 [Nippostrongylus brasiliensis]|nr:hypothetical protein Q1695_010476 [Nippostrongylus brasiliensis]